MALSSRSKYRFDSIRRRRNFRKKAGDELFVSGSVSARRANLAALERLAQGQFRSVTPEQFRRDVMECVEKEASVRQENVAEQAVASA